MVWHSVIQSMVWHCVVQSMLWHCAVQSTVWDCVVQLMAWHFVNKFVYNLTYSSCHNSLEWLTIFFSFLQPPFTTINTTKQGVTSHLRTVCMAQRHVSMSTAECQDHDFFLINIMGRRCLQTRIGFLTCFNHYHWLVNVHGPVSDSWLVLIIVIGLSVSTDACWGHYLFQLFASIKNL